MKPTPILFALLLLPAPVALAQEAGGTYVNIGEYTDDAFAPVAPPAGAMPVETYEIVPLPTYGTVPVYEVAPAPVAAMPRTRVEPMIYSEPVVYSDTPVHSDVQAMPAPVATLPYRAPSAIAGTGFADGPYEAARLAAYDTNRDGTVTTDEAIATLRPLIGG